MEKNNSKVVAVVALVVAVVALSVGFAAFSAQLNIAGDANVTVNPENTFSANLKYVASSMSCTAGENTTAVATSAGNVSDTTWSGIVATLKKPGDYVTCTATIKNESSFDGYLKSITPANDITCAPVGTGDAAASTTNATTVCGDMEMVVDVDGTATTITKASNTGLTGISTNNTIAKSSGTDTVTVTIRYKSGGAEADGDIKVTLPQINLAYKTEN